MLSYLDPIIFPDDCKVLELSPGRYIYPIYKNGSSTLHSLNLKRVDNLKDLEVIDVLIRDPYERFYSGVNTYLKNLGPEIDRKTALLFVKQYLFLNRHYCPQFYWLVNLRRFTKAKFRLLPFESISEFTNTVLNTSIVDSSLRDIFDSKVDFYLQLDKVLHQQLISQTVSFDTIIQTIKQTYPEVYKEVIFRSKELCSALG